MSLLRGLPRLAIAALALGACATTGAEGQGDLHLPTAGVGPFRKLEADEVRGVAPFVLVDKTAIFREPAALVRGGETWLYAVAKDPDDGARDVLVRSRATDGRSFYGTSADSGHRPPVVLSPDEAWEGSALSGPFAVQAPSGEVLLYYAAAGGIGLARSRDGLSFTKEPGPIFARDAGAPWETTEVRAPGVYLLPDGRFRMLYAAGAALGEAESDDGVHFRRVDPVPSTPAIEPLLAPSPPPAPGALRPGDKPPFDTASVGDPCPALRTTPAGRLHLRVLYTGTGAPTAQGVPASAVGFAARYGTDGPLVRQELPVYAVGQRESAPALADVEAGTFLYVQQERSGLGTDPYFGIAAAFAPGNVHLTSPSPFPETP